MTRRRYKVDSKTGLLTVQITGKDNSQESQKECIKLAKNLLRNLIKRHQNRQRFRYVGERKAKLKKLVLLKVQYEFLRHYHKTFYDNHINNTFNNSEKNLEVYVSIGFEAEKYKRLKKQIEDRLAKLHRIEFDGKQAKLIFHHKDHLTPKYPIEWILSDDKLVPQGSFNSNAKQIVKHVNEMIYGTYQRDETNSLVKKQSGKSKSCATVIPMDQAFIIRLSPAIFYGLKHFQADLFEQMNLAWLFASKQLDKLYMGYFVSKTLSDQTQAQAIADKINKFVHLNFKVSVKNGNVSLKQKEVKPYQPKQYISLRDWGKDEESHSLIYDCWGQSQQAIKDTVKKIQTQLRNLKGNYIYCDAGRIIIPAPILRAAEYLLPEFYQKNIKPYFANAQVDWNYTIGLAYSCCIEDQMKIDDLIKLYNKVLITPKLSITYDKEKHRIEFYSRTETIPQRHKRLQAIPLNLKLIGTDVIKLSLPDTIQASDRDSLYDMLRTTKESTKNYAEARVVKNSAAWRVNVPAVHMLALLCVRNPIKNKIQLSSRRYISKKDPANSWLVDKTYVDTWSLFANYIKPYFLNSSLQANLTIKGGIVFSKELTKQEAQQLAKNLNAILKKLIACRVVREKLSEVRDADLASLSIKTLYFHKRPASIITLSKLEHYKKLAPMPKDQSHTLECIKQQIMNSQARIEVSMVSDDPDEPMEDVDVIDDIDDVVMLEDTTTSSTSSAPTITGEKRSRIAAFAKRDANNPATVKGTLFAPPKPASTQEKSEKQDLRSRKRKKM